MGLPRSGTFSNIFILMSAVRQSFPLINGQSTRAKGETGAIMKNDCLFNRTPEAVVKHAGDSRRILWVDTDTTAEAVLSLSVRQKADLPLNGKL